MHQKLDKDRELNPKAFNKDLVLMMVLDDLKRYEDGCWIKGRNRKWRNNEDNNF